MTAISPAALEKRLPRRPAAGPAPARVRARAPLRLGFAGGGTDVAPFRHEHGGLVMNAAIGLFAYAHLNGREDGRVYFNAADIGEIAEEPAAGRLEPAGPAILHKGVYNRMVREFHGGAPLPVSVTTTVEAPKGSGLGSSSALVVALVEAYREYLRVPLSEHEIAALAFSIEREDLGLAGGAQDQYAAAFGGFNFIEFQKSGGVVVNPLRIRADLIRELEASIVLYFVGNSRDSADIVRQQQTNMIAHDSVAIEALRGLKDEAVLMKEAILRADVPALGGILNRGWIQKKRTAKAVSNAEIDALMDNAFAHGAFAAKLSGAGGGGFMMLLCEPARRHELTGHLKAKGAGEILPCHFVQGGVESWRLK